MCLRQSHSMPRASFKQVINLKSLCWSVWKERTLSQRYLHCYCRVSLQRQEIGWAGPSNLDGPESQQTEQRSRVTGALFALHNCHVAGLILRLHLFLSFDARPWMRLSSSCRDVHGEPVAADGLWAVACCCQPALTRSPQRLCQGSILYAGGCHRVLPQSFYGGKHSTTTSSGICMKAVQDNHLSNVRVSHDWLYLHMNTVGHAWLRVINMLTLIGFTSWNLDNRVKPRWSKHARDGSLGVVMRVCGCLWLLEIKVSLILNLFHVRWLSLADTMSDCVWKH